MITISEYIIIIINNNNNNNNYNYNYKYNYNQPYPSIMYLHVILGRRRHFPGVLCVANACRSNLHHIFLYPDDVVFLRGAHDCNCSHPGLSGSAFERLCADMISVLALRLFILPICSPCIAVTMNVLVPSLLLVLATTNKPKCLHILCVDNLLYVLPTATVLGQRDLQGCISPSI